jgi:hypothetical protein
MALARQNARFNFINIKQPFAVVIRTSTFLPSIKTFGGDGKATIFMNTIKINYSIHKTRGAIGFALNGEALMRAIKINYYAHTFLLLF